VIFQSKTGIMNFVLYSKNIKKYLNSQAFYKISHYLSRYFMLWHS
jgi:hypothetical protein